MLKSFSGRLLILTTIFVMLAEVLIFVPTIARFREEYLMNRLERAQIASLTLLANDMIDPALEAELLRTAEVFNVVLRRDEVRQLVLSSPMPQSILKTYDLRDASALTLIKDAFMQLADTQDGVIRVIGAPVQDAGSLIEITMQTVPLRDAMVDYGFRILLLSAVISIITATLLFIALRDLLLKPIKSVVGHMQNYALAPEDARRIIAPSADVTEVREAEEALMKLETELTQALRQKERLAQLGQAVSKISHDLRNILTTAQLFTDRIEMSEDPSVIDAGLWQSRGAQPDIDGRGTGSHRPRRRGQRKPCRGRGGDRICAECPQRPANTGRPRTNVPRAGQSGSQCTPSHCCHRAWRRDPRDGQRPPQKLGDRGAG